MFLCVWDVLSRYSIDRNTDLERFFNIDALSGVISTAKPLDREVNSVHNLTILAIETRELTQATVLTLLTMLTPLQPGPAVKTLLSIRGFWSWDKLF